MYAYAVYLLVSRAAIDSAIKMVRSSAESLHRGSIFVIDCGKNTDLYSWKIFKYVIRRNYEMY